MFDTSWDVDKYKNDYESDEHWSLRRQFMETHKDKFPEFRLVCLTQVFFNVEFLGCRYPGKTMALVNKLSNEVAQDFRESRKGKLKRTFVGAQDAAGAKAKGAKPPPGTVDGQTDADKVDSSQPNKKQRIESSQESLSAVQPQHTHNGDECPEELRELAKTMIFMIPPRTNSRTEQDGIVIMKQNFSKSDMSRPITGSKKGGWTHDILIKAPNSPGKPNIKIASAFAMAQKDAKGESATAAVKKLSKYLTTIKPNPDWFKEGGTPDFIEKRIPCKKNPRTYLIMTKKDTGHISAEVADVLIKNFISSSNEDMFFIDTEYHLSEKNNLMNQCQRNHEHVKFRHFGKNLTLEEHHICIYKKKTPAQILDEARQNGWKHPKYIVTPSPLFR